MATKRHVAVFGLSANPPTHTCGHAGVVRHVAPLADEVRARAGGATPRTRTRRASSPAGLPCARTRTHTPQLWVLPVFQHAFASKSNLAPFEHRLRMCELGLAAAAPGVRVLDTERHVCEAQARGVQRRGCGATNTRLTRACAVLHGA
jgi:hypothetical protein